MALIVKKNETGTTYQCSCCGQEYAELPLTFGSEFPDYYYSVPPGEKRIELAESLCVVDDEHFFHRGRLTIPIKDYDQDLIFNVWTTISKDNFIKRNTLWNDPRRIEEKPYFGWLQTTVPTYSNTINIKTIAIENEVGLIPTIEIIEEEHPLAIDQKDGITLDRAMEIVDLILNQLHKS